MANDNPPAAYNNARGVASSETNGLVGHYQKYRTRLSQTRLVITTAAAQYLQTLHTHWGCTLGHIVVGLSAVLWISIPAAASMVAPKRTNERALWELYDDCYSKILHRPDALTDAKLIMPVCQSAERNNCFDCVPNVTFNTIKYIMHHYLA